MSIKKDIMWRVGVIYITLLLFGGTILGRVFYLQFFEASKWKQESAKLTLKNSIVEANRGDIRAWDGRLLATTVPYYEVRVDLLSEHITSELIREKIDSLSIALANLFKDKTAMEYKSNLLEARRKGNRYFLLKKGVTYDQLKKMQAFPVFNLGRYKGGLIALRENKRIKPHGLLAARTIGYQMLEQNSNVGIEGSFDNYLKGTEGVRLMKRISGSIWIPMNDKNEVEPKDGMDIITSIDINLQDVAQFALYKQLSQHEAHHGCVILMEVATGDIKAIANLERDANGNYVESYNYAIGESTEPGSTFKLATLMVAIEDGFIDLNDTIDTGKGAVRFYNQLVKDTKDGGHGKLSVKQIFEVSSNVGVTKIIVNYYKGREKRFIDRLYSMKLNEKLGLEIYGEGAARIRYPGDQLWSGVSLPMVSFGYEVEMTPLQILTFYNAVANSGRMVKPRFVREIQYHGKTIKTFDTKVINPSICSAATIRKAKEMLEGVVENGTATNLKNSNYKIAGKTGTAQIANKKHGYKTSEGVSYQASFVGYFPADNPKYSCIVVINAPSRKVYYGNVVAGPVFKEIADKVYATSPDLHDVIKRNDDNKLKDAPIVCNGYKEELDNILGFLKIKTNSNGVVTDWVKAERKNNELEFDNLTIVKSFVPNVKGMGLKDALYLLENAGLQVLLSGKGIVYEQSLLPGTPVNKGMPITIKLGLM
jgi:cell division protein FtsI (penicillin-binding protein 3)